MGNADGPQKGRLRNLNTQELSSSMVSAGQYPADCIKVGADGSEEPCERRVPPVDEYPWMLSRVDYDVLKNALACAGASMADPLMSLVDTAFVGRLGLLPLAALGPNAALFNVIFFLCFTPLAVICTQDMAAANSKGDLEGVGRGFLQALAAMALVSSGLVLLLVAAPGSVLGVFQTNAEIIPFARTYCVIRALSLPAALSMAVCQAAFRSLLDLSTPFFVVMTASAANFVLDEIFMFRMGGGMAGCGWASVLSQYIGAVLFACVIYRRRHKFGLPAALQAAPARYQAVYGTSTSGLLPAFYGGGGKAGAAAKLPAVVQQLLQPLQPSQQPAVAAVAAALAVAAAPAGEVAGDMDGFLGLRVAAGRGLLKHEKRNCDYGEESPFRGDYSEWSPMGVDIQQRQYSLYQQQHSGQQLGRRRISETYPDPAPYIGTSHNSSSSSSNSKDPTPAAWGLFPGSSGHGSSNSGDGSSVGSNSSGASDSTGRADHDEIHAPLLPPRQPMWKVERKSSDSKLPRTERVGLLRRLAMLVASLDWRGFGKRFAGLTTRGLLILSTYTSASVVAARSGTSMIAGHQVVQQQQQMQMSVAWSFLHVGQSMVANIYHSPLPLGPKAARRLASRIISWSAFLCSSLACLTWVFQEHLSRLFVKEPEVLRLVGSAAVPATLMLGIAWNNALEGCLLGADDNAYVVKVYPLAVVACLLELAATVVQGKGLTGVWWGLWMYYFVLLLGFAHRFWFRRSKL